MGKLFNFAAGLSLLLVFMSTFSFAEDIDSDSELENVGSIDWVDLQKREIVIGDILYILPLDLKVHEANAGLATDFSLIKGKKVRFEIDSTTVGSDQQVITDIWLAK